jgi:hypothetical protein
MADLPRRDLGRTGLPVTMLGYGAMELRGAPRGRDVTEAQAETILNAVLDAGINYLDTSIDYGLSDGHEHRRHHQPSTPAGQHRRPAERPFTVGDLYGGQASPGNRWLIILREVARVAPSAAALSTLA